MKTIDKLAKENLYEKVKHRNITEVSRGLYHLISVSGSKNHSIIGTCKTVFYMYGHDFNGMDLPSNITYEKFRQEYPDLFEDHLSSLWKCIDAGFLV